MTFTLDKLVLPVLASAVISIGGWSVSQSNRISTLEAEVSAIRENQAAIRADVEFIREWIMNHDFRNPPSTTTVVNPPAQRR